jgi:hypothetical protein
MAELTDWTYAHCKAQKFYKEPRAAGKPRHIRVSAFISAFDTREGAQENLKLLAVNHKDKAGKWVVQQLTVKAEDNAKFVCGKKAWSLLPEDKQLGESSSFLRKAKGLFLIWYRTSKSSIDCPFYGPHRLWELGLEVLKIEAVGEGVRIGAL